MFTWEMFNGNCGALLRVRSVYYVLLKTSRCKDDERKQLRLLNDQEPGRSQRSLIIVGLVNYGMGRASS